MTTVSNVVSSPVFSSDGRLIAAGIGQNRVRAWDVLTLRTHATLIGADGAMAFSPDGRALLTRGTNGFLKWFNVGTETMQERIPLERGEEIGDNVALSLDGQILAATMKDRTVAFFDVKTGAHKGTAPNTNFVFHLAFSPNGKLLAGACDQYNAEWGSPAAIIWDVQTHARVVAITGHTDLGLFVAFSPDGGILATSSADDSIRFWDTTTWNEIPPSLRQKEYVTSLGFSPNGRTLATASHDGLMKLWNAVTRREVASLKLDTDAMKIWFSPDGQTLAAQNWDGTLRLWRAPVPDSEKTRPPDQ